VVKPTSWHRRMAAEFVTCGLLSAAVSGCLEVREEAYEHDEEQRCAKCHGDPEREGDFLLKSAPPGDLSGASDVSYPGVGAHLLHLLPSPTHAAIACTECHVIPSAANTEGHADNGLPAEIEFGPLASSANSLPTYDTERRSCSDTWCHGPDEVRWTRPRPPSETCGTCHGLPPDLPHPQVEDCSLCHGEVVDEEGLFARPELHINGQVEVGVPGCSSCHGSEDSPAPPPDLEGNTSSSAEGVGAHRAHLNATLSRALACEECHNLPSPSAPLSHVDGHSAQVTFRGPAEANGSSPIWSRTEGSCASTWCHGLGASGGATDPIWTSARALSCDGCHALPPPAPHAPVEQCELCHAEVVGKDLEIHTPALHVNGTVEVAVPQDCTSCHGDTNAAPPRDIRGNLSTTFSGVGAHQTHILGTDTARAVPCDECHTPIKNVNDFSHFDTPLPAELLFSGVALSYGAEPLYVGGRCENSYCHGADFEDERLSGGALTAPTWTTVDGTEAACGTCHGLPPPLYHVQLEDCASCHRNVRPDNRSFYDPSLHVNGIPETVLPGRP
jgi:predicted CxxxxCH...CXXCH cytochrome family protein